APTPDEEFFLAALLLADGEWARAKERLVRLLTSRNGANPAFMAFYVNQLIQHDELDRAASWAEQLEAAEPGSLRSVSSRARLLHARKQTDEARKLLRDHAAAHAKDAGQQLGLGRLMEVLGFAEDAEKAFRASAALRNTPQSQIPLIQFLGRRNRTGEALK